MRVLHVVLAAAHHFFRSHRFNIYIYDYCVKRGFKNTARELQLEADLFPETPPPINARQGLLFECVPMAVRPFEPSMTVSADGGVYSGYYLLPKQTALAQMRHFSTHRCAILLASVTWLTSRRAWHRNVQRQPVHQLQPTSRRTSRSAL